jgi:hypothetical protein
MDFEENQTLSSLFVGVFYLVPGFGLKWTVFDIIYFPI